MGPVHPIGPVVPGLCFSLLVALDFNCIVCAHCMSRRNRERHWVRVFVIIVNRENFLTVISCALLSHLVARARVFFVLNLGQNSSWYQSSRLESTGKHRSHGAQPVLGLRQS